MARIITDKQFCHKLFAVRKKLYGPARRSWIPRVNPRHFVKQLPGDPYIRCIVIFITFISLYWLMATL